LIARSKLLRSSTRSAWIKGILSNVPLPMPVNPVSIGLSAADIAKAYEDRQRFSWLDFYFELID
jgi:hypothetical protein